MSLLILGSLLPGFVVCFIASFVVRRFAQRWGLLDRPSAHKTHTRAVPLGGGLAIWLAVVLPLAAGQLVLWLVGSGIIPLESMPSLVETHLDGLRQQSAKLWIVLGGGTLLMILGLLDDLRGLSWRLRLGVQFAVAFLMVASGWRLSLFLPYPVITSGISLLWIVGIVNSFNMLDNMDGLSAGVAAIAASILAAAMLLVPDPQTHGPQLFVAGFLLVLAGALYGFLWHNYSPARLFMGDAGSYFIGFLIAMATLSATFSGGAMPRHAIMAPLCVLAIPIYDTLSVIVLRLRAGRSPFAADNRHFSHRLVDLGFSRKIAVLLIYLASLVCGISALLLHRVAAFGAVVILLLVASVLLVIALLEIVARKKTL